MKSNSRLQGSRLACSCLLIAGLLSSGLSPAAAETGKAPQATPAPGTILNQAKAHLAASRPAQAEGLLSNYLQTQPNAPDAAECYFLLGQAQAKLGKADDALRTFSGLVFRYPGSEWAAHALEQQASIHTQRRNPSEANKCRDELLAKYPKSPATARVWTGVADGLFAAEKFAEAAAAYRKIGGSLTPAATQSFTIAKTLAESGGDPAKLLPIAQDALDKNRIELATPLYQYLLKSPKAGRHLPQIQTRLGWCLYTKGDKQGREAAEKLWKEVFRNTRPPDPWFAEASWHLVQLAAGPKSDLQGAVAMCDRIARVQPAGSFPHEQALFAKAWLLTAHGKGKEAVAAFENLAAAYPEKMKQPPIQRYLAEAKASAAKQPE